MPHGGPWGRDGWGYSSMAQFLANRGYAVLQPNFRASTGYGKKFLDAGNGQWGDKMQDDITWGVKYLVGQGIADPKRIGIMGGSYGGYATLAGVTYTPDVYAAAVAIVAPSNLNTLLNSIPPYWESIRKTFHTRMGDPNTAEGKAQLDRQSPLNYVEQDQDAADDRPGRQRSARQTRPRPTRSSSRSASGITRSSTCLLRTKATVSQRPVNNMAMFAESEKFLAKYLGGRYQETMTPEVTQRLKEITVDVKTVALAKKPDVTGAPAASLGGKWTLVADAGQSDHHRDGDKAGRRQLYRRNFCFDRQRHYRRRKDQREYFYRDAQSRHPGPDRRPSDGR